MGVVVRRGAGRCLVLVLAGLVGIGAVPGAWAGPEVDCRQEATDEGAARALAVACGIEIEVISARTEWETLVALPGGGMRLDVTALASRTLVDGRWVDVDPTLVAAGEGFEVAAPVVEMTFSDGRAGAPLVRMNRDGHELVFDVPFDLPKPVVEGSRLSYEQVLPGVDLVVSVDEDATGFSEVLVVESAQAAAHPALAELKMGLEVSESLEVREAGGGFEAVAGDGERVFASPVPVMWDSATVMDQLVSEGARGLIVEDGALGVVAGQADLVEAPGLASRVEVVDAHLSGQELTLVPDGRMLADPDTVWPVFIDPSISGSLVQWTAVRDAFGPKYQFAGDEGVGLCSRATSSSCSTTFRSRLMWQFGNLAAVGALDSADVISATFSVMGTHSYDCTPQPVTLYRVADFDGTTSWPGGPLWEPLDTRTVTHRPGCANVHQGPLEFNATRQAQAIADAGTAVGSLGLAVDESSMAYWKRYANDATFSVTYNRAPVAPTGAGTVSPASACVSGGSRPMVNSATPTLRATVSDPDGGSLRAEFQVFRISDGVAVWFSPLTAPLASGQAHQLKVPAGALVSDVAYRWQVRGWDARNKTGPFTGCEFLVDTKAPGLPTVTAVAGQPGVYAENAWSGGLGKTGRFAFGNGGSNDVVSYRYSFNNTALTQTVTGATPTAAFTPSAVGVTTLRVASVDRAGWTSPVRTYVFYVKMAGRSARWLFDEGTGATAQDSVGSSPLALTGAEWTDGFLAAIGFDPADRALNAKTGARAVSGSPVVATTESFSVTAIVKVDELANVVGGGSATAVSQDGSSVSGFSLGYRIHSSCPNGGCLSMFMYPMDTVTSPVQAASSIVPQAGHWYGLIGMYDATNKKIGMAACDLGTAGAWETITNAPTVTWVNHTSSWQALGQFAVGRGQSGGQPARPWPGAVGEVNVYVGLIDDNELKRVCTPTFVEPQGEL